MVDYKDTLNLPKTEFEMRAGLAVKEPRQIAAWEQIDLYGKILGSRAKAPRFVLHDGPPYANGHLHNGTVLNKILKDMVVKSRTLAGSRVAYIPGWDCHGLPIEVQVDKELGAKKAEMSKVEIRAACRAYAEKFVDIQRNEFKRLGVLGRWGEPYLTMNKSYEAQAVRELAGFAEAGLLYKGLRPVNWCTVHRTALAEAEVEYEDHCSPSIYVAFPLQKDSAAVVGQDVDMVIWTTTPWTLPANLAIAVHPDYQYIAYPVRGRLRIVARPLIEAFLTAVGEPAFDEGKVAAQFKGSALEGLKYWHPLMKRESPVILAPHVTLDAGTGCVHTAPGHGPEDFDIGRRYGLAVLSPVDAAGVFTEEAGPFAGEQVFAANTTIVSALVAAGILLNREGETVSHRYAHCWRCHKPIILRATEQWFVGLDKPYSGGATLRERALTAIQGVRWIPPWGEDRIRGMLEARPDWCLSRQRTWGVPIPVFYCESCNTQHAKADTMRKVADVFAQKGADAWFELPVAELAGPIKCEQCGKDRFRKEEDILDVWFESGVSFASVIVREKEGHREGPPVDLYLEGSDQHRGWFHSSLLCSLAVHQQAPFRQVLTHGFVVDGEGKKESKSKGNYVDPFKTIDKDGAELMRLWVAGEDYREDIRISPEILSRLAETYRKIRNTLRFLLGNVSDFVPSRDWVTADQMLPLDRYALSVHGRTVERIKAAYADYYFHVVMQNIVETCAVELSAFYLDILKDRLYASSPHSLERRSAQTALYVMTRDLLLLLSPVLCFTAEEAWANLPKLDGDPASVHLGYMPGTSKKGALVSLRNAITAQGEDLDRRFHAAVEARKAVLAALEVERREKRIGSSVEAAITIAAPEQLADELRVIGEAELAEFYIVSKAQIVSGATLSVSVAKAPGTKCVRCWLYREDIGASVAHPAVCGRCAEVL